MKVTGFSGASGSGKSFISQELCAKRGIEAMVDDGLLIVRGNIVCGRSAKKQMTKLGAVKTAIFTDEEHCRLVSEEIKKQKLKSLMVIGTSDRMVDMICERLGVEKPSEYIHIEDVSTPGQIKKARMMRDQAGTHVIPAPTMQVRKQFSGYFLDPRKGFRKDAQGKGQSSEKTVVRPTYSYLGSFKVSDKVVSDITMHLAKQTPGIADVLWVACDSSDEGMYIRIIIRCRFAAPVKDAALSLQQKVCKMVSDMTAFNILGMEVEVRGFVNALQGPKKSSQGAKSTSSY